MVFSEQVFDLEVFEGGRVDTDDVWCLRGVNFSQKWRFAASIKGLSHVHSDSQE